MNGFRELVKTASIGLDLATPAGMRATESVGRKHEQYVVPEELDECTAGGVGMV